MAELLIKAIDATHSNPDKDAKGCYKRGDIVLIRPNGHTWGSKELKAPADGGKFIVLKITDVTPAQVRNWVHNNWQTNVEDSDPEGRRRRVHINIATIPAAVRSIMNTTGEYTTTWAAIRQYVRNKKTAATATGATV